MKNMMLLLFVLLAGCSPIYNLMNGSYVVWEEGMDIEKVKIPKGFKITPQEIYEVMPLSKYQWNIYADNKYYYVSSSTLITFHKNDYGYSYRKDSGYKIAGDDRALYEKLLIAKGLFDRLLPEQLSKLIGGSRVMPQG